MPQPHSDGKGALTFQGVVPYPPLNKVDDWGLNVDEQVRRPDRRCWERPGLRPGPGRAGVRIARHATDRGSAAMARPAGQAPAADPRGQADG